MPPRPPPHCGHGEPSRTGELHQKDFNDRPDVGQNESWKVGEAAHENVQRHRQLLVTVVGP
jgi:hypothetical protein